ncbi:hypothetical protein ADL26_14730 [Thermoactinomyces vulgaris]|jgi:hypothetical protein|nr:hypothetical protein ADL26_14730 [Thermoactinomyces vulgaris]
MHERAAIFACRFTGVVGLLFSLFLWKVNGLPSFVAGLVSSCFWFALAWWIQRRAGSAIK